METKTILEKSCVDINSTKLKQLVSPIPNPNHLEQEKRKFFQFAMGFTELINIQNNQCSGRPRFDLQDIIKSLLVMSYNGMSYRRAQSDLIDMQEKGFIKKTPSRSVLSKYMLESELRKLIEKLIEISASFFLEDEDTLILDSTCMATKMYSGGHKKVYKKELAPMHKIRKLHIACLKESKIITSARATTGTINDSLMFKKLVYRTYKNGFNIKTVIADAGYLSKENYAYCQELGIDSVYIDFKKSVRYRRAKSKAWVKALKEYKENPQAWHQTYKFRVLVEGVFSAIKKKQLNYLRSRKENAQDCELLLKCLIYNFTIIGKHF